MNIMEDNNKIAATDARFDKLFEKISVIIEQSRQFVKTAVNIAEVKARYEVGRYIFEDEQQGGRAAYGKQTIPNLSSLLIEKYGDDWTIDTLTRCRKFFKAYQDAVILATPLPKLRNSNDVANNEKDTNFGNDVAKIQLPRFTLSWSHYLILMRIENNEAKDSQRCQRFCHAVRPLSARQTTVAGKTQTMDRRV